MTPGVGCSEVNAVEALIHVEGAARVSKMRPETQALRQASAAKDLHLSAARVEARRLREAEAAKRSALAARVGNVEVARYTAGKAARHASGGNLGAHAG